MLDAPFMELFERENVFSEYPLHIIFADELAIDTGGLL